ncbi:hypothetical protein [Nocardia sp. N2S4-5]|uniref:hypothetical protein n=1 Tax=Nocardia sp. N2S4-5 TaxID=3351565 RepID=UPI0037D7DE26
MRRPDQVLLNIGALTNLVFVMTDADHDGLIGKDDTVRLMSEVLGLSDDDAATAWKALGTADAAEASYTQCLTAMTEFITSTDSKAPGNSLFGPL